MLATKCFDLRVIVDDRGRLTVGEAGNPIPFTPVRFFTISDVPPDARRGEHAHRHCHEFLVCVAGSCEVIADDGSMQQRVPLNSPSVGLHLAPMTWRTMERFSIGSVLLVLASLPYDESDYIRDYGEFLRLAHGHSG